LEVRLQNGFSILCLVEFMQKTAIMHMTNNDALNPQISQIHADFCFIREIRVICG